MDSIERCGRLGGPAGESRHRAFRVTMLALTACVCVLLGCNASGRVEETVRSGSGRLEAVRLDAGRGGCHSIVEYLVVRPSFSRREEPWSVCVQGDTGEWHLTWEGDSLLRVTLSARPVAWGDTLVAAGAGTRPVHVVARLGR